MPEEFDKDKIIHQQRTALANHEAEICKLRREKELAIAALKAIDAADEAWRKCTKCTGEDDPLCYACYKRYEKAGEMRKVALESIKVTEEVKA